MKHLLVVSFLCGCLLSNFVAAAEKAPTPTEKPPQAAPETKSTPKSNFVKVNGVNLHYLNWGGTGEAILFLHGFPGSAHNFNEMAPKFIDRFRVLGLTRRGHGRSEKIETGYETDNLVEDVRRFLDAMKIERVNLIGFSAGGDELTRFATLYPERTLKLVYLDAAYDRRDVSDLEKKDPLFSQSSAALLTAIEVAMIKSQDEFRPDYSKIKSPALSYYAIAEKHWDVKADTNEAARKKAQEFVENVVQPRQWKNIEQFRRDMVNGKIVILRDTHHNFCRDPKLKDEIAREVRAFLMGN